MTTGDEEGNDLVDDLFREVDDQFKDLEREYLQAREGLDVSDMDRRTDPLEAANERFALMSEVASLRSEIARQSDQLDERDRLLAELGDRIAGFEAAEGSRNQLVADLKAAEQSVVEEKREQARLQALLDARAAERQELAEVAHRLQNERDHVQDLLTTSIARFDEVDTARSEMDAKLHHLEAAQQTATREHENRSNELIEARAKITELTDQVTDLTRLSKTATERADKAEHLAERKTNEAGYLNRRMESMSEKVQQTDGLDAQVVSLKRQLTDLERTNTQLERDLTSQRAEAAASAAAVESIANRASEYDELVARIGVLEQERDDAWKASLRGDDEDATAPVEASGASLAERAKELGARRSTETVDPTPAYAYTPPPAAALVPPPAAPTPPPIVDEVPVVAAPVVEALPEPPLPPPPPLTTITFAPEPAPEPVIEELPAPPPVPELVAVPVAEELPAPPPAPEPVAEELPAPPPTPELVAVPVAEELPAPPPAPEPVAEEMPAPPQAPEPVAVPVEEAPQASAFAAAAEGIDPATGQPRVDLAYRQELSDDATIDAIANAAARAEATAAVEDLPAPPPAPPIIASTPAATEQPSADVPGFHFDDAGDAPQFDLLSPATAVGGGALAGTRKRTVLPADLSPNTPQAVAHLLSQRGVVAIVDARSTCGRTGIRPSELFQHVEALRDHFDVPIEVVVTPVSTPIGGAPTLAAIGVHHVLGADTVADRVRALCMGFPADQPLVVIAGDDHVRRAAIGEEANVVDPSAVLNVVR